MQFQKIAGKKMKTSAEQKPSFGGLPDLMTRQDLANYFRVSLRTTYNWIAQQILPEPAVLIGKRPRWSRQQIEQVIIAAKVAAHED
jgi:predicted DNA-binding transcriptional regulator AlpA